MRSASSTDLDASTDSDALRALKVHGDGSPHNDKQFSYASGLGRRLLLKYHTVAIAEAATFQLRAVPLYKKESVVFSEIHSTYFPRARIRYHVQCIDSEKIFKVTDLIRRSLTESKSSRRPA